MPTTAFVYGQNKAADFKSDAARFVAAKVIPNAERVVQSGGQAAGHLAPAGARRALASIPRPAASAGSQAAGGVKYMNPWARTLGGAAIGTTVGGLGGAYRGYTHDRREPMVSGISQGLIGGLAGGVIGGLTGHVVNPAFHA